MKLVKVGLPLVVLAIIAATTIGSACDILSQLFGPA